MPRLEEIGEHICTRLRVFTAFAIALMICAVSLSVPELQWAPAHAADQEEGREEGRPKGAPKEQQERAPFTAEDENAAVVPGIPDARAWGDSETDFARLLPQASGPWLAISGGGSDGAYGARRARRLVAIGHAARIRRGDGSEHRLAGCAVCFPRVAL